MDKEQKSIYRELLPIFLIMVLSFTVLTIAYTYAFFKYERSGRNENSLFTANVNVFLDDHGEPGIQQVGAFPVYDEVGRKTDPYSFELKNLGSVAVRYKLKLVADEKAIEADHCKSNLISDNSLRVQLIKNGTVILEKLISELEDYEIDAGYLGVRDEDHKVESYELRLWIDKEAGAEVMNRHYHGRVDVELIDARK